MISCQRYKIGYLLLYSGECQTTQKLVHFYMLITLKHFKVVEKFLKDLFNMVKNTHLLNGHML